MTSALQTAFETICALTADSNAKPEDVTAASFAFAGAINAATEAELAKFHADNPAPVSADPGPAAA